jgi:hypothetical protein
VKILGPVFSSADIILEPVSRHSIACAARRGKRERPAKERSWRQIAGSIRDGQFAAPRSRVLLG